MIRAGVLELTVSIRTIEDDLTEATETLVLELSVVDGPAVTGAVDRVTVSIVDDDVPVVPEPPAVVVVTATLRVSELSVSEGDTTTLNIDLSEAASEDVTLTLTVVGGSAVESVDYEPLLVPVVIRAGVLELTVSIRTIEDDVTEATETLVLELSVLDGPAVIGVLDRVRVTIIDDDSTVVPEPPAVVVVTATLSLPTLSVPEDETRTFEILLSNSAPEDLTFTLVGGPSGEYILSPDPIVISKGGNRVTVTVMAVDDTDPESDEVFTLSLMSESSLVMIGDRGSITVTIPANDQKATNVEFVVATASIDEGDEYEIELRLVDAMGNPLSHTDDVSATLVVFPAATTLLDDEYLFSSTVTIIAGKITGTARFRSVENDVDEPDKFVTLQIKDVTVVSQNSRDMFTITVRDDDDPVQDVTATLSVSTLNIREDETQTILVRLSEAPASDVTVELTRVSGTATEGDDYSLSPRLLTFTPSGSLELSALISGVLDSLYEGPEDVVFELSVLSGPAVVGVTDTVTVTIADGDTAPTVSFDIADSTVDEGDTANVVVMLSGRSQDAVTVNFMVSGSATEGADYTTPGTSVTIPANSDRTMITFAIKDESRYDGVTETVILTLTSAAGDVTVGATNVHTLTIDDRQNRPTLSLDPIAAVAEGGTRNVVARLSGALDENVIVTLTATPGTAGTDDYSLVQTSVTIPSGTLEATFMVSATDDDVYEGNEDLTLSASAPGVTGTPARDLTIMEMAGETAPTLSLGTVATVDEGTAIEIVVNLSGAYATDIEVTLELLSGGTATESEDYTRPSQLSMMISAGSTMATFRIVTVDDTLYEGMTPETLMFRVTSSDIGGGPLSGTAMIRDNESVPTVSFDIADSTVDEGDTANVVVMLSGRSEDAVTVNFMVSGNAMVGADYTTPGTSVTIPANSDSTTITFAIKDESRYDGVTETVILTLTSATGDVTVGATNVHTLTIDDRQNRPTLSLDPVAAVAEGGTRNVVARLSGALDENVIVTLMATPGTAGTDDYSLVQTSVTILSGTLEATFMVSATDDDVYEGNEDLTLSASAPGVTGTPSRDLTIMEMAGETAPTLSLGTVTTVDEGTAIEIVVNLSGAYATDIEVTLELLSGGTATESEDYTRPSQLSMMISAGSTMATFRIVTVDDTLYEGMTPETLLFRVTSSDIGGGPLSGTAMIRDNESVPTVSFDIADSTVDEGDTANVVVMLSGRSQDAVTVNFMVSGSAMVGADYTTPGTSVTIPANSDSTTITFAIKDESRYDGVTETVILTLTSATGDVTVGATNVHTLTIDDRQNRPTLSLDPVAAVAEGGTRNVVARLSGALDENVIVTLMATPGTAGTDDYSLVQTSVTILSGTLEATFMVSATDDDVYEGNEDLTLSASAPGVTGTPSRDLTIMEMAGETAPTLSLGTVTTVDEGTAIEIVVNLSGAYATDIEVTLELLSGGTATESEDYTRPSQLSMMISAGSTMATFRIATKIDNLYEGTTPETLMFRVTSSDIGGGPLSGTAMIMDVDSAPTVSFDIADSTVDEGDTANVVVMLSGRSQDAVTVNFMVSGSAMVGADYTTPGTSVTIPANSDSTMITFAIKDESRYDGVTETVILTLTSATGDVTVGATNVHTLTIDDRQNRPTLSLDPIAAVAEGGTRNVVARLSGALDENVIVTLTATPGTAGTDDYSLVQTSVTIPSGTLEATFMVSATDDDVYEGNEDLTLSASAPGVTGTPSRDLTIMEMAGETAPTLSLGTVATVDEGTAIEIVVNLSGAYATDIEVTLELLSGGTATESEDYTRPSQLSMMISAGSTMVTFTIATKIDNLYEGTTPETLMFRITSSNANGGPLSGTAMIMDVDSAPTVSFDIADSTVDEGDTANVVVMLSGRSQDAVTVNFMVSGSAMVGADYTTPGTSVTIPANSDSTMITFAIKDESRYDGVTETVILTLTSATGDVTVGATNVHTLTIDDRQNRPTLSLDPVAAVAEGGTRNVVVRLSGVLDENVIVTLTATPGTAGTDDYSLVQTSVTIPSGTLEATFMVSATDDDVYEGNEDLTLSASAPGVTGTPARDLTITDNDEVEIGFAPVMYTVDEDAGTIELTVRLFGGRLDRDVTLNYRAVDSTAIAGADYNTGAVSTITLSPGDTEATIMIDIVDDSLLETNETFTVVLSGAPVGVILNPDTAEVTIRGMADAIINPGDMGLYCDNNISTTDPKACVRVNSMISTGPLVLVIEYIGIRSQVDSIIGMGSLPDGTAVLLGAPVWDIYFEDANGNQMQTLSNTVEVEFTIPRDLVDANVDADVEAGDVSIGVLHTGSVEWLILSTSYNPVDSNYSFTASIDGFSFFNLIVPVEAEFRSTEMSVREGESIDLFIDLTVATSRDITVALNRIAGDAIEGVDYELSSLPVTIKAGMRTGRVSFTSLYDFDSQSEMVEFELSVSNGAVAGLMSRVKVRIVDNYDNDGLPPLSLNLTVPDVQEGDSGVVTVELSYALPEPTEVAVRVVGGTAEMNDYELPAGSVTINAGETTAEFDLRAICDILPEGDETLMLEAIATTRLFSLTSSQSEGMIQDISIEIDGVSELDEDDDADIRVRLSGDRCNPTTVSLTVIGGTADVSDYTLLSDSEVIPAGSREARFRLIADRDREREADETLVLVASVVGLEDMMLTVTILDVDVDDGLALPPTGGLALPGWLLGVLTLVGVLAVAVSLGGLLGRRRNRA